MHILQLVQAERFRDQHNDVRTLFRVAVCTAVLAIFLMLAALYYAIDVRRTTQAGLPTDHLGDLSEGSRTSALRNTSVYVFILQGVNMALGLLAASKVLAGLNSGAPFPSTGTNTSSSSGGGGGGGSPSNGGSAVWPLYWPFVVLSAFTLILLSFKLNLLLIAIALLSHLALYLLRMNQMRAAYMRGERF